MIGPGQERHRFLVGLRKWMIHFVKAHFMAVSSAVL